MIGFSTHIAGSTNNAAVATFGVTVEPNSGLHVFTAGIFNDLAVVGCSTEKVAPTYWV